MGLSIRFLSRKPHSNGNYSIEGLYETISSRLEEKGYKVKQYCVPYRGSSPLSVILNLLYTLRFFFKPIIVTGDINYVLWTRVFIKSILVVHDMDLHKYNRIDGWKAHLYYYIWFNVPLSVSTRIITVSDFTRRELVQKFPRLESKTYVVENFLRRSFEEAPVYINDSLKDYVLFIGQTKNKNFERSYFAIRSVSDVKIIVIGSKDRVIENCSSEMAKLEGVIFKTNISDSELKGLYGNALFLCFPSLYEGFGLPIIEAQFMGCTVLTSNIDPMLSVSGGQDSSILVNPEEISSIAAGVRYILKMSDEEIEELAIRGQENAEKYTIDKAVDKFIKVSHICVE